MTVETTAVFKGYVGDSVTTVFPTTFYFSVNSQIVVLINGVTSPLSYSVTGAGLSTGGSVTFTTPPPTGVAISISRLLPITQEQDVRNNETILQDVLEGALDRLTMIDQQQQGSIDRAVVVPAGETGYTLVSRATRANTIWANDGSGDLFMSPGNVPNVLAGTFGAQLVAAANAAAALDVLDVVNIYNEITLNGTVAIGSGFPACYLLTDSPVPADYGITLPVGSLVGSLVFFRVDVNATKLFTLGDSGTDMEGNDRIILQAGESVMLKKLASGWKRVGGVSLPIHGMLRRTATFNLTSGVATPIIWNECVGNIRGLQHGFTAGQFYAPRAGVYEVDVQLFTTGSADLQSSFLEIIADNNADRRPLSAQYGRTGSLRLFHHLSMLVKLNRTGLVSPRVTVTGTTPTVEYIAGSVEATMTFKEII